MWLPHAIAIDSIALRQTAAVAWGSASSARRGIDVLNSALGAVPHHAGGLLVSIPSGWLQMPCSPTSDNVGACRLFLSGCGRWIRCAWRFAGRRLWCCVISSAPGRLRPSVACRGRGYGLWMLRKRVCLRCTLALGIHRRIVQTGGGAGAPCNQVVSLGRSGFCVVHLTLKQVESLAGWMTEHRLALALRVRPGVGSSVLYWCTPPATKLN